MRNCDAARKNAKKYPRRSALDLGANANHRVARSRSVADVVGTGSSARRRRRDARFDSRVDPRWNESERSRYGGGGDGGGGGACGAHGGLGGLDGLGGGDGGGEDGRFGGGGLGGGDGGGGLGAGGGGLGAGGGGLASVDVGGPPIVARY